MIKNLFVFSLILFSNVLFAQIRNTFRHSEQSLQRLDQIKHSKTLHAKDQLQDQRLKEIFNTNSVTCLTDSVYQYTWDTLANNWYLSFISYFGYNSYGNTVIDSFKQWNGVAMANVFADSYYYTGSNMTLSYQYSWNGSAWDDSWKTTNTFSGSDLISQLDQSWNASGYWENTNLQAYTYAGGNQATDTMKYWNGSTWMPNLLYNYTYSGANLTNILMRNWSANSWTNYGQISRTYSGNALTYVLNETWNGNSWDSSWQTFYNYSGGIVTTELFQNRIGNTWVNSGMDSLFYCPANVCPSMILQKEWAHNAWRNHYKMVYFGCNSVSDIKQIKDASEKASIYPNPSTGMVTIESSEELQKVSCINSLGEVVFEEGIQSTKKQLDLSALSRGIYFIKLKTGSALLVKKIFLNN